MKTKSFQSLAFAMLCTSACIIGRAEPTAYSQILKERENVLSRIVAAQESRLASGHANEDAVLSARLALYAFRRDTASTMSAKVEQQTLIISAHEKRLVVIRGRASVGEVPEVEVLQAMDTVLQARQALEKLRSSDHQA